MKHPWIVLAAFVGVSFAGPATAAVYDAAADFSTASNPNGVWTYGRGTIGSFTPLSHSTSFTALAGTVTFDEWGTAGGPFLTPSIFANHTASVLDPSYDAVTFANLSVPVGFAGVHPGPSASFLLQFTAPVTSAYNYSIDVRRADMRPAGDGVGATVVAGASTLLARTVLPAVFGSSTTATGTIALNAGDTVFIEIDPNTEFTFDSTAFAATFTTVDVPEPASALVLATGLGLLGWGRKRR